ncbi:MAG: PEP-CTERM sorting domain-containing protein, partial [Rubrivivax sp.]|nr:PEP-CTERM sorting domain-containing protein [Rubrivivax sp.]
RQLWDVVALGEPLLGRERATDGVDTVIPDAATQLAAFKAALAGGDDASFMAGLSAALAQPLIGGDTPLLVLDGQLLGAPAAQLSVYYTPSSNSGDFAFSLAAAERHAIWRTGFDRLELLQGPAQLYFSAGSYGSGSVGLGGSEYIGESFDGVLHLDGAGQALRIQLNNFYSPGFLVVASWNVSAVPEPATWLQLAAGALLLSWRRRPLARDREHR